MLNFKFKRLLVVAADCAGGPGSMSTALLRQIQLLRRIQLVALYQSALGAAELQTHFTDGATTSWFT